MHGVESGVGRFYRLSRAMIGRRIHCMELKVVLYDPATDSVTEVRNPLHGVESL